jgi:hypothetical protein
VKVLATYLAVPVQGGQQQGLDGALATLANMIDLFLVAHCFALGRFLHVFVEALTVLHLGFL